MATNLFKQEIAEALANTELFTKEQVLGLMTIPQDPQHGNFSVPCFSLAKTLRKAPKIIAEDLSKQISLPSSVSKCEAINGYLNYYIDPQILLQKILSAVAEQGEKFGHLPSQNKTVIIDYSSPNIGKELAFHHIRSTMIGHALSCIYQAAGYKVIRINHLGDWGTQFGKLIVMYLRAELPTDVESLAKLTVKELNLLYTQFSKAAQKKPEMEDEAREVFAKLEAGDEFYRSLWEAFKEATLKELRRIYKQLGVDFDYYTGESFFEDLIPPVIDELKAKNLLEVSQEREVVMLEDLDLPPCLIRKSDGSTLYATRDLAAAIYRQKEYAFDRCLYVVDQGQALHFKQVFAVLNKMGYAWSKNMVHIPFGLILHQNEDGKWEKGKTRTGSASLLRDVIAAAQEKILEQIQEKNPDLPDAEHVAMQIGVSALTFNDLKNRRLMDVKFDWDSALSFEGATGPYLQNAHVRLCSIQRRAGYQVELSQVDWFHLTDDYSMELVRIIDRKSTRISQAVEHDEPALLAQYALEIAEAAHRFVHHNRVLGSAEEKSRLFLVQCTQIVLKDVLTMLGVYPIEAM
ncbi:MAG: arginine--tRNA ligase [Fibrobacter sp.]|nr:arginine--tRNA ligase [Fibrobacter sp.]